MLRLPLILVLLASTFLSPSGMSAGAGEDPLAHLRPGHPRLLFTDDELGAAKAAAATDPLRAALHQRIIATAEAILPARSLRYAGDPSAPEEERIAVYDILTCAMAYRLTGEERFAARVKSDLLTITAFPDWNPRRDLSIGEMSFAVAIGYDWLYAQLPPDVRATVRRTLVEKSVRFAARSYDSGPSHRAASWTINTGNHNQVSNAGMVSAALAVAEDEPELARRVIAGATVSMRHALTAYAPDGGYPEGPGYWTYGTTYSAITFAALETALGTDLGLAEVPGFSRTVTYYEAVQSPSGRMFNYADATDDLQNSPARAWLAQRYQVWPALRDTRALLARTLTQGSITPFDRAIQAQVVNRFFALHAVWFPGEPAGSDPSSDLPLDFHFRGVADIATFRSAWNDPRAIFVGFKAGENGDHHNHLDLGSFILDADGERWAMDLGPDSTNASYDLPGYFDNKARRWTYFRANNHSHNTVTPGDGLQSRHVVAPIVAFGSEPRRAFAVADLTPAYPGAAASLRRGIALLDRSRVLVQDEYKPLPSGTPLHWTMVTPKKTSLTADGRSALLTANGHSLRVDILEPAAVRFHLGSTRPPTAEENQNEGTVLLAVDVMPGSETTRLAVLLTPLGDKWPQPEPPALKPLASWP